MRGAHPHSESSMPSEQEGLTCWGVCDGYETTYRSGTRFSSQTKKTEKYPWSESSELRL